jgi:DNA-binding ferritin-like protein (Dps family)
MDEVNIGVLEGVIAHELNHVMAEPILFPAGRTFTSWEDRWKDRITRNIVSEGVAFRCNPITGFQKNLWEDRATIVSLLKELNGKLLSLDRHELQENDVREWYGKLFQEFAASLLKQYLQKTYPDSAVKTLAVQNFVFRPDLVHALGWWMVSRITENGVKKEKAIELLTNPASLYELYNKTLERGMDDVAVDARVVAMFSKH